MYRFTVHAIAPFVSHAISVLLCLFLIAKNPRSKTHIALGLFCLAASLWQFSTGMMFMAQSDELALFWDRVVYVGVNFQWLMHFQFTVLLLKAKGQTRWLIAAYALAAIFALFIPTDWLLHGLYRYPWGCHSIAGPLHHPFVLVSTAFYVKCLHLIFRRFQQSDSQIERTRYKYYMVGFTIFVSASLAYLPAYEISIYPFAYWFETIYCIILAHVIVKYRMLEIETVIHKTVLWLAVSLAMFVPVALVLYLAYKTLIGLGVYPFIGSGIALLAVTIAYYSVVQPKIDHVFQRTKYNYQQIVDEFMETVVTLNDTDKLADVTRDTVRRAVYSENVRCFWGVDGRLEESGSGGGEPMRLELKAAVAEHLVRANELVESDQLFAHPVHGRVAEALEDLFEKTSSQLLVPIVHDGAVRGLVSLGRKSNLKTYTELDKRFLRDIAVGVSVAIINSLVFETQKKLFEKERETRKAQEELLRVKEEMNRELEQKVLERTEALSSALRQLNTTNDVLQATRDALWGEMELASKIQRVLLPKQPSIPGYEICAYSKPASHVGGDYYDVINSRGRNWLVIGDVSGHGVTAGLIMMMAQTAVRTALAENQALQPKRLLSVVNECLWNNIQQMDERQYVTMTILSCRDDGEFVFAGLHQDILIARAGQRSIEAIESQGVWVGLTSSIDELISEQSVRLAVGDSMLLFTDGITEAIPSSGSAGASGDTLGELFGQTRLEQVFSRSWQCSPGEIRDQIVKALDGYNCVDDVTFVVVKRTR